MLKPVSADLTKMATSIVGKLNQKEKQNQNAVSIQMLTKTMAFLS